jgi:hypothetical protein
MAVLKQNDLDELMQRLERSRNLLDFAQRLYMTTQSQEQLASYCDALRGSSTGPDQIAAAALPQPGSSSKLGRTNSQFRRSSQMYHSRLLLPQWVLPYTYTLLVHRATCGWQVSLQCSRVIRPDLPGILAIERRDVCEVRRLLDTGVLSRYDEDVEQNDLARVCLQHKECPAHAELRSTRPGWEISTLSNYFTVVEAQSQYFIRRLLLIGVLTTWVLASRSFFVYFPRYSQPGFEAVASAFRVLVDECDIDPEELMKYVDAPLLLHRLASSWTTQERLVVFRDMAYFGYPLCNILCVLEPAFHEAIYFTTKLSIWHGPFLLHLLAESLERCVSTNDSLPAELTRLAEIGVCVPGALHALSSLGSGMTPLMHLWIGAMGYWDTPETPFHASKFFRTLDSALKGWLEVLVTAGVDLGKYGEIERELFRAHWRGCQSMLWTYCSRHARIFGFSHGSKPSDWRLWIADPVDCYAGLFWELLEHPEWSLPGAWVDEVAYEPSPTAWRPRYTLCNVGPFYYDDCPE